MRFPPWVTQSAFFTTPHHRLWLRRRLGGSGPPVAFLLHNPSKAGHDRNDPTLNRGIGFANAMNASDLVFVNLFTGIATDADDLASMRDPVGPMADYAIEVAWNFARKGVMIAAPGLPKGRSGTRALGALRYAHVIENLAREGRTIYALRLTKAGYPEHLLYLPKTLTPFPITGFGSF